MKAPRIYYLALAVFSIMTLFIGMVHAADMTQPPARVMGIRGHGFPGMNVTNASVQQHILAGLEAKGVDVSAAKTLLQTNDTSGVSTWLATYFAGHNNERLNMTSRFNGSAGIRFPTEKSDNLSVMKTAFHSNAAAGSNWSGTRLQPHNGGVGKNTTRCNSTAIISDLEKKGVDVSSVKTALQNGDVTAITSWLKSYFQTTLSGQTPRHAAWGHGNTTGPQNRT
jgi:hypothetical protein